MPEFVRQAQRARRDLAGNFKTIFYRSTTNTETANSNLPKVFSEEFDDFSEVIECKILALNNLRKKYIHVNDSNIQKV